MHWSNFHLCLPTIVKRKHCEISRTLEFALTCILKVTLYFSFIRVKKNVKFIILSQVFYLSNFANRILGIIEICLIISLFTNKS